MSKGLKVFTSNRLEILVDELAQTVRVPLRSIFEPELVVVQSQGMARWLSLELAERNQICSNYNFLFPNAFAHKAFKAVWPDLPSQLDCQPEVLVWKILRELSQDITSEAFTEIRNYLGDEKDPRKQFQLCSRIAWLYDQYLIFRPELIEAWDRGEESHWQAQLWRDISANRKAPHTVELRRRFVETMYASSTALRHLPERISVFGISALPPFHIELLESLSTKLEVTLYLLQPCQEFWGYISSQKEIDRTLKKQKAADASALHLESGNRLLASMGKSGRDFLNLIFERDNLTPCERFCASTEDTMLATIQNDILFLEDRGTNGCPVKVLSPNDESIQIHSCHSPMRELEVLYDCMLDWFEKDRDLAPRDIIVLTPDIDLYAPFIQAVFDCAEEHRKRINYSLADRNLRSEGLILESFFSLLNLPASRFGALEVLTFLESPAIRQKFELQETDTIFIRQWVQSCGIRWGIDADHRAAFDVPRFDANSWRQGLHRMLLGYAMKGCDQLVEGILPYDEIEGGRARILGRFVNFAEKLFATSARLQTRQTLPEWETLLQHIVGDFFESTDEHTREIELIRAALNKLRESGDVAEFRDPVDLATVVEFLSGELSESPYGSNFLNGSVTFAALKPMRSLPFKVVCVIGMNDQTFPRRSSQLAFDLMSESPKLGDRSVREDDRYLFLETLLSAREKLHISYVGQSIRDNSPAPPSVVVSELLDYIEQGFATESGEKVADQIVFKHRLQAFHEQYFSGAKLFTYSLENFQAAQSLLKAQKVVRKFFEQPLPAPDQEYRSVTIDDLVSFFCNPAEFLLTRRLQIRLPREEEEFGENEPFVLDSRDSYSIKQQLLDSALAGKDIEQCEHIFMAAGVLPLADIGKTAFRTLCAEVETFIERLQPFCPRETLPAINVDFAINEFRLNGRLVGLTRNGLLRYRVASVKPTDLLKLWIPHLVLNIVQASGRASEAIHVGSDETAVLSPVRDARARLEELLNLYWKGLTTPLKFFPQSSFAYARAKQRQAIGKGRAEPLGEAYKKWNDMTVRDGVDYRTVPGERANPYFEQCFNESAPFDPEFEAIAEKVFGVILASQRSAE